MYGLLLRALEGYVCTTFEEGRWSLMLEGAGVRASGFEPLLIYDRALFQAVLEQGAKILGRPSAIILEDVGTFVVTNPQFPAPRRLLRFSGESFEEFLLSLEELPERAHLALPDVHLPRIALRQGEDGDYHVSCAPHQPEVLHILHGLLRAMADDYGALVFIDQDMIEGSRLGQNALTIRMAEIAHAQGNQFQLAGA